MSYRHRIIKQLASLKLAVVILVALMVLIGWGTIVESRYNAYAARKLVYDTWMMYAAMAMLSVSLIAVMVDRWPWKKRHIPFLLAHVGILILLFGSVLTMKLGVDGSVVVPIGGQSNSIVLPNDTDLLVYASYGGQGMAKLSEEEVDFFVDPPTEAKPHKISVANGETIDVVEYKKYVLPRREVVASTEPVSVPAVRFQIQNGRVSVIEWLVPRSPSKPATHDFGPAKIHLGPTPAKGNGANEIFLTVHGDGKIKWTLFRKDSEKPAASGLTEEGGVVRTGWMGLELRILRFLPRAREKTELEERPAPTELTTSAIKVRFRGNEHWILLDDTLRLFTEDTAYLVSYNHRRLELGFPLKLLEFKLIPYQGTRRAKEYMSHVVFPEGGPRPISMNEPAVYDGLTFYQASFHNDEAGNAVASVFSVNRDPGRWWKYLGSLIISLGIVWLFWNKRRKKV